MMVDIYSPPKSITITLPSDLVAELQLLAQEKLLCVDEVVREACLAYTEPYIWERSCKEWLRNHPGQQPCELGMDGNDLAAPGSEKKAK